MKLKKFDSTTANGHTSKPSILFSLVGTITLNKDFFSKVGLEVNDKVSITQDEDNPDDWYLLIDDENGFALRQNKSKDRLLFNNAATAKAVIDHFKFRTKSVSFQIATEPTPIDDKENEVTGKLYCILKHTAKFIELPKVQSQTDANDQAAPGDQSNS
jgi:hypothetical protein